MALKDWQDNGLNQSLQSICSGFFFEYRNKDKCWFVSLKKGNTSEPIFRCLDVDNLPCKPKRMHVYSARMLRDYRADPRRSTIEWQRGEASKTYKKRYEFRETLKDKVKDYFKYARSKIELPTVNLDRVGREEFLMMNYPELYSAMQSARIQAPPSTRHLINGFGAKR